MSGLNLPHCTDQREFMDSVVQLFTQLDTELGLLGKQLGRAAGGQRQSALRQVPVEVIAGNCVFTARKAIQSTKAILLNASRRGQRIDSSQFIHSLDSSLVAVAALEMEIRGMN
jgi:hypothetical protein